MKRFILNVSLFIGLIIVSFTVAFLVFPISKWNYLRAYTDKMQLMRDTASPKIVLIGGSNVGFSLSAKAIADTFGISAVNAGLHASIGLRMMLDDADRYLRKGDIAVLAPEYSQFTHAMDGENGPTLCQIVSISPMNKLLTLNARQLGNVLSGIPLHTYEAFRQRGDREYDKIYTSAAFNSYGDHVSQYDLPHMDFPLNRRNIGTPRKEWVRHVAQTIKEWQRRGVKVLFVPPVLIETVYHRDEYDIKSIYDMMESQGTPFAFEATRNVVPDTMAYDTQYHMRRPGMEIYTANVISALRRLMAD